MRQTLGVLILLAFPLVVTAQTPALGPEFQVNSYTTGYLKAEHGSSYTPPPCAGIFPDVPCSNPFVPWIEQLFAEGVTGGCGGGNYCPANPNTRGQMAVFLVKTFGLKLYGGD